MNCLAEDVNQDNRNKCARKWQPSQEKRRQTLYLKTCDMHVFHIAYACRKDMSTSHVKKTCHPQENIIINRILPSYYMSLWPQNGGTSYLRV